MVIRSFVWCFIGIRVEFNLGLMIILYNFFLFFCLVVFGRGVFFKLVGWFWKFFMVFRVGKYFVKRRGVLEGGLSND